VKIRKVECNNQKRAFEVTTFSGRTFSFPYARVTPSPDSANQVREAYPDLDFGKEAFTYVLESGDEGTVHIDHLLEYSGTPKFMARFALHKLTVEARKRVEESPLSKREIMRRLGTSQAQLHRLLDPANYKKSLNQLVELLAAVDCEVEIVVKGKTQGA
jgi:predicted XRE-type DNA-binding protein